jgi:hypothetical protein
MQSSAISLDSYFSPLCIFFCELPLMIFMQSLIWCLSSSLFITYFYLAIAFNLLFSITSRLIQTRQNLVVTRRVGLQLGFVQKVVAARAAEVVAGRARTHIKMKGRGQLKTHKQTDLWEMWANTRFPETMVNRVRRNRPAGKSTPNGSDSRWAKKERVPK